MQKTDVAEVPNSEAALPDVQAEPSVPEVNDTNEDKHLAQEHRLKKMVAYVREKPKTAGVSARKGSTVRMKRFRANKNAQGFFQAYVPADVLDIAKSEDCGWETMRVAIAIGRRVLALRGWRAKFVAMLLPRGEGLRWPER